MFTQIALEIDDYTTLRVTPAVCSCPDECGVPQLRITLESDSMNAIDVHLQGDIPAIQRLARELADGIDRLTPAPVPA